MKKGTINTITHIMIWSAFFVLLLLFMPFYDIHLLQHPFLFFGVFVFLIFYYYFNSSVLVPRFLAQKRIVSFVAMTFSILLVYIYFSEVADWLQPPEPRQEKHMPAPMRDKFWLMPEPGYFVPEKPESQRPMHQQSPWRMPANSLLTFLLVFTVSTGTRIISSWFDTENEKNIAEKEKSKAELAALKAQVNPHFLFNTLNNIYYMAMRKSEETAETIMKLSDLMRFVLTETQVDFVPLSKEIECIDQYIGLQSLRLTEKTTVNFTIEGNIEHQIISPLLLLPFVENAFKHGVSTHVSSHISIKLSLKRNVLRFKVANRKERRAGVRTTGMGLNNVIRRLELIYPKRHELDISEDEESFIANLKIDLS